MNPVDVLSEREPPWRPRSLAAVVWMSLAAHAGAGPGPEILIHREGLGVRRPGVASTHAVSWINLGSTTFEARGVSVSCDCVRVLAYPPRTPPGAAFELHLRVAPETPGDFQYSIVVAGGENQPTLVAQFDVTVAETSEARRRMAAERGAWLMSAGEVTDALAAGGERWLIADVRPRERFLLGHLPDALNLPLRELRLRPSLRRKPILIVSDGHDTQRLLREAASLAASGFTQVRVLEGGLYAWRQSGRELAGLAPDSERLFSLEPGEAMSLLGPADVRWLRLAQPDDAGFARPIQMPVVREVTPTDLPGLVAALNDARPDEAARVACLVVVSRDGSGYAAIEARVGPAAPVPVFFVAGGEVGLAAAMATEARLARRKRVIQVSGQGSQGVRTGEARHAGGGGCCGRGN